MTCSKSNKYQKPVLGEFFSNKTRGADCVSGGTAGPDHCHNGGTAGTECNPTGTSVK